MSQTPKISYIDENCQSVSPEYFLSPFQNTGFDTTRALNFIKRMDYVGNIPMNADDFSRVLEKFGSKAQNFFALSALKQGEQVNLRGNEYYLHISLENDKEKIRSAIVKNMLALDDILGSEPSNPGSVSEEEMFSSLLDHKKHYAMCVLFGIYASMLDNDEISSGVLGKSKEYCLSSIRDYYGFVLDRAKPKNIRIEDEVIDVFQKISLPTDSQGTPLRPKGETGARKLIMREMDHPGQLILFGGNLLKYDGHSKIDIVVNPLYGGIEIGLALKAIYERLNLDKIDEVHFIRYSRYGEFHTDDIKRALSKHIPKSEHKELENLFNKRIFLIDDNAFSGESLKELVEFLEEYSKNVKTAVIERPVTLKDKRPDLRIVEASELSVPVVSKLRYIDRIEQQIMRNLGRAHG